jgi:hypothetical protein
MGFRDNFDNIGSKTAFHEYFNDFNDYNAADWVITTTEDGTGSATEVTMDEQFGALLVTNAAGDNDLDFLQKQFENFKYVSGKRLYFGARVKLLEVLQADFVMGLQIRDTTMLAVSDGIWFGKDDGDALLDFHVAKDSTQTDEVSVGTMVADTYVKIEFYYDGSTASNANLQVFVDDVRVAGVSLANVPDDELLTLSMGLQNGQAVVNTMTIDWVRAVQER